ncbi:VanZ family protein [Membranihabitans marinus]|uniref:VanZ family protein n=1 Tax=Membranihabitans marinus TaxID=1227546 RepID=UPI00336D50A7
MLTVICALSLAPIQTPMQKSISVIPNLDKIAHFGMYFVLSNISALYFRHRRIKHQIRYSFLFCLSWGIMMELIQKTKIVNRDFDIADIIANIIGCILGLIFFKYFKI